MFRCVVDRVAMNIAERRPAQDVRKRNKSPRERSRQEPVLHMNSRKLDGLTESFLSPYLTWTGPGSSPSVYVPGGA